MLSSRFCHDDLKLAFAGQLIACNALPAALTETWHAVIRVKDIFDVNGKGMRASEEGPLFGFVLAFHDIRRIAH